jgi:hypothetical protein
MDGALLFSLVYGGTGILLVLIIMLSRRAKRHGGSYRSGVVGAMYEWQNRDKQKALDTIVEGRAAETRPEYPDGDLPQLERPDSERGDASARSPGTARHGRRGRPTSG